MRIPFGGADDVAAVVKSGMILVVVAEVVLGEVCVVEAVVLESLPQRTATSSEWTQSCVPQPAWTQSSRCASFP